MSVTKPFKRQRRSEFGPATRRRGDADADDDGAGDAPAARRRRGVAAARFYGDLVAARGVGWAGPLDDGHQDAHEEQPEEVEGAAPEEQPATARADGVAVLPPRRRGATAAPPLHPEEAQPPTKYGIPSDNVGFRLLKKAGWTEGTGVGKEEQGVHAPIELAAQRGVRGLGYEQAKPKEEGRAAAAEGGEGKAPRRRGRGAALPPDPLDGEDLQARVRRVGAAMQAEADDAAGKALQRWLYRELAEPGAPGGAAAADRHNPLLRPGRNRLSRTNPLL